METLKFSLFYSEKGIKNTTPTKTVDLKTLFAIFESSRLKELTESIREATDEETRNQLKLMLPYITPHGVFSKRENKGITHYNKNFLALDFDKLPTEEVRKVKELLRRAGCCYYIGTSSRGHGVKALIHMPHEFTPGNHYLSAKHNVEKILRLCNVQDYDTDLAKYKTDLAQFVLCQPFFLSHDPDAIYNFEPCHIGGIEPLRAYTPEHKIYSGLTPVKDIIPEAKTRIEAIIKGYYNSLVDGYLATTEGSRHLSIAKCKSFAGYVRQYTPQLEHEYKEGLKKVITLMYGSDTVAKNSGAITSFTSAWEEIPFALSETIEKINNESDLLKKVSSYLLDRFEIEIDQDKIIKTLRGAKWTFNNYTLAYFNQDTETLNIQILGIPTTDKINRLNFLPGVNIKLAANNQLLLNGKFWEGESIEIVLTSKTISI
jgi:hypothetical protein